MLDLIIVFFKVGVLGFGGGSAVAPLIKNEAVTKRKWITEEEFLEIVAMANSLPGPSMSQMAAAIGYKRKGLFGAFVASAMIILPMVITFIVLMRFLLTYIDAKLIVKATKPVLVVISASMLILAKQFYLKAKGKIRPLVFGLIALPVAILLIVTTLYPSFFIILMIILVIIFVREDKKNA